MPPARQKFHEWSTGLGVLVCRSIGGYKRNCKELTCWVRKTAIVIPPNDCHCRWLLDLSGSKPRVVRNSNGVPSGKEIQCDWRHAVVQQPKYRMQEGLKTNRSRS